MPTSNTRFSTTLATNWPHRAYGRCLDHSASTSRTLPPGVNLARCFSVLHAYPMVARFEGRGSCNLDVDRSDLSSSCYRSSSCAFCGAMTALLAKLREETILLANEHVRGIQTVHRKALDGSRSCCGEIGWSRGLGAIAGLGLRQSSVPLCWWHGNGSGSASCMQRIDFLVLQNPLNIHHEINLVSDIHNGKPRASCPGSTIFPCPDVNLTALPLRDGIELQNTVQWLLWNRFDPPTLRSLRRSDLALSPFSPEQPVASARHP
jgi:hypothetical protein